MTEITEIGSGELERWLSLTRTVRPDRGGSVGDYLDWQRQAEDMAWFVASADGHDVGSGFAYVGWHSMPGTGNGEAFVLPQHRGRGFGTALYHELSGWVQQRGCVTLETTVPEDDADSVAWADRRGFREVGRNSRLALDLSSIDEPAIDPPDGVQIVTWADRPDLTRAIYEVACEAYPDVPGSKETPMDSYENWLLRDMQGASDRPESTFVALSGDEVVGYAKLALSSSRSSVVLHDMTGVRRAFRGRGIASALKRAEIAWAKRSGYQTLETLNEVRNEPIRRLNERHGYALLPGVIVMHESLAGIE